MVLEKVEKYIAKNNLLSKNSAVIVGLSGGADSMVLLDILLKLDYKCIAAHVNFHLRGSESDRDELFVINASKRLNIELEKVDFDTIKYSTEKKISIEMAARELRYNWFQELCKIHDTNQVAIAHHADDSIETALLNLTRGTGIKGITGIKPKNGNVIRPILPLFRHEIENYAKTFGIDYVNDSTNAQNEYQRNKIRNCIIPLFEDINPNFRETMLSNIINFESCANIYFNEMEKISKKITSQTKNQTFIDISLLKKENEIETILYEILKNYNFNSSNISEIFKSLDKQSGLKFYSPTHILLKDREKLILEKINENEIENGIIERETSKIEQPIAFVISRFTRNNDKISFEKNRNIATIDEDLIEYPLTIRRWRNGDFFYPLGMRGRKKVSDFLIDIKSNLIEKEGTKVLVDNRGNIVWIVGKRIDDRFKLIDSTKNIVKFEVE